MKEVPMLYTTARGFTFELDGSLCLPPDDVSEYLGHEAGKIINTLCDTLEVRHEPNKVVRVLELGVGSGIGLISAFEEIHDFEKVEFHGIDVDEYAVGLTTANLNKLALNRNVEPPIKIWQSDWFDEETWDSLSSNKYNVILFNPPYFPSGSRVREKHKLIPLKTMTTDDEEGLEHYTQVMSRLHRILSNESGSTIIIRRRGKADEYNEGIIALQKNMLSQIHGSCKIQTTKFLLPYGKFVHYITARMD